MQEAATVMAYRPYVENFWRFVQQEQAEVEGYNRELAVEHCRKFCINTGTFKLVNMAIGFVTHHVREANKEILHILADFHLSSRYTGGEGTARKVVMRVSVEIENGRLNRRRFHRDEIYELLLLVNADGFIVDVDFSCLIAKFEKAMACSKKYP